MKVVGLQQQNPESREFCRAHKSKSQSLWENRKEDGETFQLKGI